MTRHNRTAKARNLTLILPGKDATLSKAETQVGSSRSQTTWTGRWSKSRSWSVFHWSGRRHRGALTADCQLVLLKLKCLNQFCSAGKVCTSTTTTFDLLVLHQWLKLVVWLVHSIVIISLIKMGDVSSCCFVGSCYCICSLFDGVSYFVERLLGHDFCLC